MAFAALKADAAVVVAYGLLLPQAILDAPTHGCFNVHASLLPRWRGAAPIHRAIMAGDGETGVTIMRMELGLDTGPMMKVGRLAIQPETTTLMLHDQLATLGAELMVEVLQNPSAQGTVQPIEGVTYAKKIDKAEARVDFSRTAVEVRNHIHGLSPFPGAWVMMGDARVKVLAAEIGDGPLSFPCADKNIRFVSLQREGKGVMDAATFLRGFPNATL
jgi:methionyl-tRNA formyltransferase